MKKILTVSLFAMMAVSAANADIASTAYVETAKTTAISTAASDATSKANAAKEAAISAAASDATSKANQAKADAIAAIPAVDSTFNKDSNNAATSKAIAGYISSELGVLKGQQSAINDSIGELEADIAAINNETTGILALAKADATSKANAAQSAAELKVTALQNGAVKTNTDNIAAMDEAYKAADAALDGRLTTAEGNITSLQSNKANTEYVNTELNKKQNNLSQTQMDAVNSTITSEKVTKYEAYDAKITAAKKAGDDAQADVDALETTVSAMDAAYKAADTATLSSAKSYADAEDKKIEDTIGTVPADKTVVGMIAEAQTAATYDDTAVRGLISDNADEINTIKSSAYATSGITKAKVDTYDGYDAKITAAKKAGDDAQADVDALKTTVSDMDTAYKLADTNIKNTIGDVASDKTVVGMIADAKSGAVTEAANDAKTKYQVKSSAAYTIGTTGGGWTDLKSLTGYSKTGTFSLVLKNDVLQWEAVNY